MIAPNRITALECARSLVLRSKDKLSITVADYMAFAKDIFSDLNMKGIKDAKRVVFPVNRKINTIDLDGDNIMIASVYRPDECGIMIPMWSNPNIPETIKDLSAKKHCDCGCDLCAQVKNYEPLEENVSMEMPDGSNQTFRKSLYKYVKSDGSYIERLNEPIKKYDKEGVHIATVMDETETVLCNLDVNDKGCILDNKSNEKKIYANCSFVDLRHECGCPTSPNECSPRNDFKISDDGNRIILPPDHSYSHVVVRYYYDLKTKDILIPKVAKKVFMEKLYYEGIKFDKTVSAGHRFEVAQWISISESRMISDLSRMTLSETYRLLAPQR